MEIIKKYFSDFTEVQEKQFEKLLELYTFWNSKINVISRKDIDNFYLRHVLHSLTIAAKFNFKAGMEVMDLGCGGGLPGIPLAILFPEVHFHLVDSIGKKLIVVDDIVEKIGLKNVTTEHTRVEEMKGRQFDVVVSRAVAPLGTIWYWCRRSIRKAKVAEKDVPNGLICLKGGDLAQEISVSNCKPNVWEIDKIFEEDFFKDKFLLYQPQKKNV